MTQSSDIVSDMASDMPDADKKQGKDAIVIKAVHALKIKTGPGGFDQMNIKKAERRLEGAAHLFPQAASDDLAILDDALAVIHDTMDVHDPQAIALLQDVLASVVALKAHSAMFNFPLVTQILDNLLPFCLSLSSVTPLARDVIAEHLRALRIAIEQGPREGTRGITPQDHADLLSGLQKAVAKVLRQQDDE